MLLNLDIPDEYFTEEEKNGFKISSKRKKVWAVELDLINEFDRVCKKHGIRYFMHGGTLLGAVRHQGFIPWDDDADFVVPRKDYERLKAIGPKEFKAPYFFQNIYTDKRYPRVHSQLRNSNTCGLRYVENDRPDTQYNCGIFIDIFVLDDVYEEPEKFDLQVKELKKITHEIKITFSPYSDNFIKDKAAKLLSIVNSKKIIEKYALEEKKLAGYNQSKYFGNITYFALANLDIKSRLLKKEWYQDVEYLPFDLLMLPAPAEYKKALEAIYGPDYMTPKYEKSRHGGLIVDTERSYKEVLKTTTAKERLELMNY